MATTRLLRGLPLVAALASSLAAAAPLTADGTDDVADYVIVGGGPAGFVVAEYLTRNPDVSVTLLDAGPDLDSDPNISVPGRFAFNDKGIWMFFVEPDPQLGGRTPDLGQGGALGGGSTINNMIYCRGAASVFDEWAEISGNYGLAWESLLEDFRATTSWQDEAEITYEQPVNASVFGDGPLAVSRQRQQFALDQRLADTMQARLNVDVVDMASGDGIGVSQGLNTIRAKDRTRSYAYSAFGHIANTRSNFHLHANAWVSTIGFAGTTADSVTYNDTTTNTMHTIRAKEIIVAAGAVKSPHLLMLSGIGPADRLEELGIPVVKDVPEVGQNLVDHHNSLVSFAAAPEELTLWQYQYDATVREEADAEYARNGDGLLGTQWGDVFATVRLPDEAFEGVDGSFFQNLPADRPHVAYQYINVGVIPDVANVSSITAWVGLVQPEATGNITLASANYQDAPTIFANYFGSPADRAAILYGYKELRSLLNCDSLKPILTKELFPSANVTSDDDIWAAIQETARSWHHPVGTVSLGTVLDANWRVKGIDGLRVVGSPAMPYVSTCPIQSTVYALSHRAAIDIATADGV
ncbi:hypothetical protein DL764_000365 [Monosporascus ibericus]|uniref:Glucose-methanol-choline oxidoreductase N-terminal domain-containing protein n=1 Tax=Monosporascus ibericus TaxID=155417 RepID=A0A4V1XCU1_9PEZI|nr:hypothetical protein DL764_000365 [Monosporascus ibericus]